MKKRTKLFLMFLLCGVFCSLCACSSGNHAIKQALNHKTVTIKESPDKYTWYIRDYVGKNLASFGKGKKDRYEEYGNGKVYFTFISTDGSLVDKTNLEGYIVVEQKHHICCFSEQKILILIKNKSK